MARGVSLLLKIDAQTRGAVSEIEKVSGKLKQTDAQAAKTRASYQKVGTGALLAGGAILAGFGLAISTTAKFEKSMSKVGAVADASGKQLNGLREAAIAAGRDTAFTASEAAEAEAELAKAGVSVADILGGGLKGALDLAAAGTVDLTTAATIAAQAMNIFGLSGKDVTHIADVLAAGANKSAADMEGLGLSLQQGGLLAKQTGLSFEDTVGVLSLFADNALIGSDAGTSLKTMLQRLTPQSNEAADKMRELGISAYDSGGQFIGLAGFAKNLKTSLQDLTPQARQAALGVIFGTDAIRAATVLYESGAKGVNEYRKAVNDNGAAARTAAAKLDNLSGDLEKLKGSFETTLINAGSKSTGILRGLTKAADGALHIFGELPGPVQSAAVGLVALAGAGLAVAGLAIKIAPAVAVIKALSVSMLESAGSSATAGITYSGFATTVGVSNASIVGSNTAASASFYELSVAENAAAGGGAASGLGAVFTKLGGSITTAGAAIATFLPKIGGLAGALQLANPELLAVAIADLVAPVRDYGKEWDKATEKQAKAALKSVEGAKTQGDAIKTLQRHLRSASQELERLRKTEGDLGSDKFTSQAREVDGLHRALRLLRAANDDNTSATRTAAGAAAAVSEDIEEYQKNVEKLTDSILGLGDAQRGVAGAHLSTLDAIDQVEDAQKDLNEAIASGDPEAISDAQRGYARSLLDVASAQDKEAQAAVSATDYVNQYNNAIADPKVRQATIANLTAALAAYPEQAAALLPLIQKLQDPALNTPHVAPVSTPGATTAKEKIEAFNEAVTNAPKKHDVTVNLFGAKTAHNEIDDVSVALGLVPKNTDPNLYVPGALVSKKQVDDVSRALGIADKSNADPHVSVPGADESTGKVNTTHGAVNSLNGASATATIFANTGPANSAIDALSRKLASLDAQFVTEGSRAAAAARRGDPTRALGGPIPGNPGQPVPILAHGGEYVLSADVVSRIKRGMPSSGARVNGGAPAAASTGDGGNTTNVNVSVNAGSAHPAQVGAAVVDAIRAYERSNGKAWRN